ncbi:calcium homeostasis modulator protein 2-like [Astyanax mexicanus]|uniref:calcium homeostasis modulator protein 2-like n=1 Tax=Astyanax mexicanus TaxID=7994 RepID=UPI0020CB0867|nr:calcium homeostasis modulator protein 2-like [Astyanax mexicanus]
MKHPKFTTQVLTQLLSSAGGAFVVIIFLVAFQYIFKLEFDCPCDPEENLWFCLVYIFAPILIFALIIIGADRILWKVCTSGYYFICLKRLVRALTVGVLWFVTALLDGDLIVCFMTTSENITVRTEQPVCKKEPTSDEFANITRQKNLSRVSGLVVLAGVILIWAICSCCSKCKSHTYYSKTLYDEHLLEQNELLLEDKIKEKAKKMADVNAEENLRELNLPADPEQPGTSGASQENPSHIANSENAGTSGASQENPSHIANSENAGTSGASQQKSNHTADPEEPGTSGASHQNSSTKTTNSENAGTSGASQQKSNHTADPEQPGTSGASHQNSSTKTTNSENAGISGASHQNSALSANSENAGIYGALQQNLTITANSEQPGISGASQQNSALTANSKNAGKRGMSQQNSANSDEKQRLLPKKQ